MNKKVGLSIIFMLVALVGCSSSKQVVMHQYVLPTPAVVGAYPHVNKKLTVTLEPIRLPTYLTSTRMTMVDANGVVYQANHHLWAEDLGIQMQRLGQARLKQRLPQIQWAENGYQLLIHVNAFSADNQGIAHIQGDWQLLNQQQQPVLTGSFAKQQPLAKSGYLAMTQTLSELWSKTMDGIAHKLANFQPPS